MSLQLDKLTLSDAAASRIMPRIAELEKISESDNALTRRFASVEHRRANDLVSSWMQAAGMQIREDAVGNIIGRYESSSAEQPTPAIMMGSHLDTVINAGSYDGMLGVLSAIACVESLHENQVRLAYPIEVIGFADEEGVRYQSTYLGSRAVTGDFNSDVLKRIDSDGITFVDALKKFGGDAERIDTAKRLPSELLAYLEVHIEQGPVLEVQDQAVGVVSGIAGASRLSVTLEGMAGHAGTVPMGLRRDALVAAAECIALVEKHCSSQDGLVGTVGRINAEPGAVNVIPGRVQFSIDIRALEDSLRNDKLNTLINDMTQLCSQRGIDITVDRMHDAETVSCSDSVMSSMQQALKDEGMKNIVMPSGAGHDAAAMAAITPIGMLFVRCAGGISHHPDESVTQKDAIAGARVLMRSMLNLCSDQEKNA